MSVEESVKWVAKRA